MSGERMFLIIRFVLDGDCEMILVWFPFYIVGNVVWSMVWQDFYDFLS